MSEHIVSKKSYVTIYAVLMGLLVLTVAAAFMDLGRFNLTVSLGIAVVKALFIIAIFMHVRYSEPLVWIFAGASFLWLGILISLTLADYLTRGMVPIAGK
ncbi:MAG: cytochrome C oxidase subunit IV family protein [Isosphaeraceae bacterium]|nr:cytochrome C oxidase subunit IV family protein [Isosphaeraceae bacterium]